jgi:hypothetical protein
MNKILLVIIALTLFSTVSVNAQAKRVFAGDTLPASCYSDSNDSEIFILRSGEGRGIYYCINKEWKPAWETFTPKPHPTPAPSPSPAATPNPSPTPAPAGNPLTGGAGGTRCGSYPAAPLPTAPRRRLYFDAAAGNDANSCLAGSPCKTLSKAATMATAGDELNFRGVFLNDWLSPNNSGTAANPIVFRAETGQTAEIRGGKFEGGINVIEKQHLVFSGFLVKNVGYSVQIRDSALIRLENLTVEDGGGINLHNTDDSRVEGNTLRRIGNVASNEGDAIAIWNGSDRNILVRNNVGQAGHDALSSGWYETTNNLNQDNVFAHNTTRNRASGGIILTANDRRAVVECNTVLESALDNGDAGSLMGIATSGKDATIRYNVIHRPRADGIMILGYDFGGFTQNASGNKIYHNTITGAGRACIGFFNQDKGKSENNTVINNLCAGNAGLQYEGNAFDFISDNYNALAASAWTNSSSFGNTLSHNAFSTKDFFLNIRNPAAGGNIVTINAAMILFAGWEKNIKVLDPRFVDAAKLEFSLQQTSPLIDAGKIIGEKYLGAAPDIGAFETK